MNSRIEVKHRIDTDIAKKVGTIVLGSISIPAYLRKKLEATGRKVPESISGWIFIDTTSRHTLVASTVLLDRLDLFPSGLGLLENKRFEYVYLVELKIFGNESLSSVSWDMPVKATGAPYPFDHEPGEQVIAHLGTDFLDEVEFSYNGPAGLVSLSIDPSRLAF